MGFVKCVAMYLPHTKTLYFEGKGILLLTTLGELKEKSQFFCVGAIIANYF